MWVIFDFRILSQVSSVSSVEVACKLVFPELPSPVCHHVFRTLSRFRVVRIIQVSGGSGIRKLSCQRMLLKNETYARLIVFRLNFASDIIYVLRITFSGQDRASICREYCLCLMIVFFLCLLHEDTQEISSYWQPMAGTVRSHTNCGSIRIQEIPGRVW